MDRRHLLKLLAGSAAFAAWTPSELEGLLAPGGLASHPELAFFTEEQREAVRAFSDLVIPTTDTPGAVEAGVPEYIELIVSEWYDEEERERFMRGLAHLDLHAEAATGVRFAYAGHARQTAILEGMQAEAIALREADPDAEESFFHQARGLVLRGYYTSEIGMTEDLMFIGIPGEYDGFVPLSEISRAPEAGQ